MNYVQIIHSTDHSVLKKQQPSEQHLAWEGLVMTRT